MLTFHWYGNEGVNILCCILETYFFYSDCEKCSALFWLWLRQQTPSSWKVQCTIWFKIDSKSRSNFNNNSIPYTSWWQATGWLVKKLITFTIPATCNDLPVIKLPSVSDASSSTSERFLSPSDYYQHTFYLSTHDLSVIKLPLVSGASSSTSERIHSPSDYYQHTCYL